jgi:hypothetical protein
MLLSILWATPSNTLGTHTVLTREGLTMRHTLQPWGSQETGTRGQPRAVLDRSTRRPPLRPDAASPAPTPFSTAAITLLETYGRVKGYPKNAVLIYAGTPSPACYVVLSGRVRVYASTASGKELMLSLPERGEPFGDLGLLEDAPHVGMAVTLTPTTLLVVPRTHFGACLAAHPALAQIADRIGATRETVCRAMNELYGSGCLVHANGRLRVGDHTGPPPGPRPSTGASAQEGCVPPSGA